MIDHENTTFKTSVFWMLGSKVIEFVFSFYIKSKKLGNLAAI